MALHVLKQDPKYQGVRELVEALDLLAEPKLTRMMAFVQAPQRQRTNHHVERMNRRLRFAEKVRYRWRKRRWVVRWVVLLLDICWQESAKAKASRPRTQSPVKPSLAPAPPETIREAA